MLKNYIIVENYTNEIICETDTLDEIKMFLEAYKMAEDGCDLENLTIYKVEKIKLEG